MTREDLVGYALDLLDRGERAVVDSYLASNPHELAELERIRAAFAPLEADREDDAPAPALATRTVARLAAYLVDTSPKLSPEAITLDDLAPQPLRKPVVSDRPEPRFIGGRFRADLIVAAGIGLFAVGLVLSFVNRARHANEVAYCQSNLQTLHTGLSNYADSHSGRFPQVGTEQYPTAGTFVQALADAGQCPPGFHAICPAASRANSSPVTPTSTVTYAFPLGHRSANGTVLGVWRSNNSAEENDLIPIGADYPDAACAPGPGPTSAHGWGQNVLYVGGNVRFATTSNVGVNRDDIFRNYFGDVAAGVTRVDTVLGRAGDKP